MRPATRQDSAFCFALNEATLREYIEPIYGWDVDLQREHHRGWFDPDRLRIILDDDGRPAGVLDVSDEPDCLYLSRIEILPEMQGHGIGKEIVRGLLRQGRVVRLHVFTNNVRARRFYEGLGFTVDPEMDREHRIAMRHPGLPSDATPP